MSDPGRALVMESLCGAHQAYCKHETTVAELRNLLGIVDRDLADGGVLGVSDDGRFRYAYEAALILCKLALHACGFEVQERVPGPHSFWIDSLGFTLGAE